MDYISGLWSRHCQGDTPAGGQGRAIELLVAHRGVPLREFCVLPLPGQDQGGGARAQGQALEEEPRPQELWVPPKACLHADIGISILINKYQPVKLAVYRYLSVEEAPNI